MRDILAEAAIERFRDCIGPYELNALAGLAAATKDLVNEGHFKKTEGEEPDASYKSIGEHFVKWVKEVQVGGN